MEGIGRVLLAALLPLLCTTPALGQMGAGVTIDTPHEGDLYLTGRQVHIEAPVKGDVAAAAQIVTVDAAVEEDLMAAGETVTVRAPVGDDIRAAGREVRIQTQVGDHLVAAGQTVLVEPGAEVKGFAWLAGNDVRVAGRIGGELRVWAHEVTLSGEVLGDAEISADTIRLTPGARITGNLRWHGPTPPSVSAEATVEGRTEGSPTERHHEERVGHAMSIAWLVGLLIAGVAVYLIFPLAAVAAADSLRAAPWRALGLGLALLAATPLVIILLFATVIGILLALILLALYLVALPLGWFAGALALGRTAFAAWKKRPPQRKTANAGLLAGAILLLYLLHLIPYLGFWIGLLTLLFGLGSLALSGYGSWRPKAEAGVDDRSVSQGR